MLEAWLEVTMPCDNAFVENVVEQTKNVLGLFYSHRLFYTVIIAAGCHVESSCIVVLIVVLPLVVLSRAALCCIVLCRVMLCCVVLCCVVSRVVALSRRSRARGIGTVTCHLMLGSPPTRAARPVTVCILV